MATTAKRAKAQTRGIESSAPKRARRKVSSVGGGDGRREGGKGGTAVGKLSKGPEEVKVAEGQLANVGAKMAQPVTTVQTVVKERSLFAPPLPVPIATFNI